MRHYFELDYKEKNQEYLLLFLAALCCLTIALGIYWQVQNVNHNTLLIPIFFFLAGSFFFVYSINALTKGNLTQRWTPAWIFKSLLFINKKLTAWPDNRALKFVTRLLGCGGIAISIGLFITALISTTRTLW